MIRTAENVVSPSRIYVVFPYKFGGCHTIAPKAILIPEDRTNNAATALAIFLEEDRFSMAENIVLTAEEVETLETQGLTVGMATCSI